MKTARIALFALFISLASSSSATHLDSTQIISQVMKGFRLIYSNPDSARHLVNQALVQAKTSNFPYGEMKAINVLGIAEDVTGNYDSALTLYRQARHLAEMDNRSKFIAQVGNNMGLVFWNRQQWDSAIYYYQKSEVIFRDLGFHKGLANVLNNLGLINDDMKNHTEAQKLHKQAIRIYKSLKDTMGLAAATMNLSLGYMGDNKNDSAMIYAYRSIPLLVSVNDLNGLSKVYNNLGMLYGIDTLHDSTLYFYKQSLALKYNLKNWLGVSSVCNNLASAYRLRDRLDSSLHYAELGLAIARQHELPRNMWKLYYNKARALEASGLYEQAFNALDSSRLHYSAYFENESKKRIQRLQVLHELDKKNGRIRELQQEKQISALEVERKQWQLITLFGGFILLAILALLVYLNLKKSEKNKLQQVVFEEKQRSLQSVLDATEHERERIGKELHDGIGQQLLAIKQGYDKLKNSLETTNKSSLKTAEYSKLIEGTILDVRNISHQMAPRILDDKGLIPAIEFILNLGAPEDIETRLEYFGLKKRYEKTIELTIYRSIQELLKNTIQHAKAQTFSIQLIGQENALALHVSDDGIGIPQETIATGLGLQSIQGRITSLNGSMQVTSDKGNGTHISIRIPLC